MSVSKRIQVAIRSPSIAVNGGTKFNMSLDKGNKCSRTAIRHRVLDYVVWLPLHHLKNPDLANKTRIRVKRLSNQKNWLCLQVLVLLSWKSLSWVYYFHLCMYNEVHFHIRYRLPSFRHVDFPGGTCFFYQRGIHLAPQCRTVSSSLCSCGNVFEHLSYKGAPVNCCWAIRYANKSWALKKRQLVHVAFDEKHAVWNGQCRALKERVHPHGLFMVPVLLAV